MRVFSLAPPESPTPLQGGILPTDILDDGRDYAALSAVLGEGHPVFLIGPRQWIYPEHVWTGAGMVPVETLTIEETSDGDGSPGTVDTYSYKLVCKQAFHGIMNGIEVSTECIAG